MLDGGGGTTLLVPDRGVPVLLGSGVDWLPYLARMASLFARRAASVVSMGGGVVEISSSISGCGSFCGSGCATRVMAGDCIRDETERSAELFRGEILRRMHQNGLYEKRLVKFSILTRLLPSQNRDRRVSGTRDLVCRGPCGASVPNVYLGRLDRNREAWGICGLAYGTVDDLCHVCNPVHAWIYRLGLCGLMRASSCPHSDAHLSNPWYRLCPSPSSASVLYHSSRPTCAWILTGC